MSVVAEAGAVSRVEAGSADTALLPRDDLSRDVYCVLGIPVDAIEMATTLQRIHAAADRGAPYLISTPNLNFLVKSLSDERFRESLIASDLCTADGMPIVWISRFLGIPIRERVAGSDVLEALAATGRPENPLRLFLFGGDAGVAATAGAALNARAGGLRSVGALSPGFGSVEDMSEARVLDAINASDANFLIAAIGAGKGQEWLVRNHHRIRVPVRVYLGAALNFAAGTVKRAPSRLRKSGFEWVWRIVQEPGLWTRYFRDGLVLLRLLLGSVLPLCCLRVVRAVKSPLAASRFALRQFENEDLVVVEIAGPANRAHFDDISAAFRKALRGSKPLVIDFTRATDIDARILGLILMLRKVARADRRSVVLRGVSLRLAWIMRLNRAGFLVSEARL
jgi:N-acetylglucosaminyldiphosphoundecaprenol N-acetyl-beta-D-mannosaminyltransferase